MTELTTYQPATDLAVGTTGANLIREAAAVMADAHALATAVASTQMIPKHFQGKPDECAAAMLYGASLGLDPMQSVRQIYVVHGQAALYARAMSALVQGAGHKVWTVESTDESVTVSGSRRGSEHVETSTWTFARANKAGYTSNAKYKTDPQAMLYSKALSEVCRKIAPDVLSGVYSVEEMQLEREVEVRKAATAKPQGMAALRAAVAPTEPETGEAMTDRTRGALFALMGEQGLDDADEQRAFLSDTLGREVESRASLTEAEAVAAGRRLRAWQAGEPGAAWVLDAEALDVPTEEPPAADSETGEVR